LVGRVVEFVAFEAAAGAAAEEVDTMVPGVYGLPHKQKKNSYTIPLIWILWLGLGWRNQNSPPICRPFSGESVERVRS
jgi:hypothetical protein